MKILNKIKVYIYVLLLVFSMSIVSCDYLEIEPAEQPGLSDATKDAETTLAFLYSTYGAIQNPLIYNGTENSVDEIVLPSTWGGGFQDMAKDMQVPSKPDKRWNDLYRFLGQAYLFLQELEKIETVSQEIADRGKGITEEQRTLWRAEANFIIAYYHFELLRFYGPCPIMEEYTPLTVSKSEYPGRSHYDYVTDWIVKKLDDIVPDLPDERTYDEWGRPTKIIAMSIKAKALLYAASPLWNGQFPFPNWKNENYETPGYGKELVSHSYDANKWTRAYNACLAAVKEATRLGYRLYDDEELYKRQSVSLPYIPGREESTPENESFKKKVLLMRYLVTTYYSEGNTELIWGVFPKNTYHSNNSSNVVVTIEDNIQRASLPIRALKLNNGSLYNGWGGAAPLLYTVEHFYTDKGKLPNNDSEFTPKSDWLKSADIEGREGIIKLNVGREPRFYAWIGFDDGDHTSRFANTKPIQLKLRDSKKHGYDPKDFPRYFSETGYLNQKYIRPNLSLTLSNTWNNTTTPRPLIRFGELLLNLAECEAALEKTGDAIANINLIRNRAGVPDLERSEITSEMTITDWVHQERFIELWLEGNRYYDLRRWCKAPIYLKEGAREGLNGRVKANPTFEEFNTRVKVPQIFKWSNRMYLSPIIDEEVYRNPQLMQAPGYY